MDKPFWMLLVEPRKLGKDKNGRPKVLDQRLPRSIYKVLREAEDAAKSLAFHTNRQVLIMECCATIDPSQHWEYGNDWYGDAAQEFGDVMPPPKPEWMG
jgi:hypothetical protein